MYIWVILYGIFGELGVYFSVIRVYGDGGKGNKCKEGKKIWYNLRKVNIK